MNTIPDFKRGDDWNGMELLIEDSFINEANVEVFFPLDLTGYTVISKFKANPTGIAYFEFTTADGTIAIPNPLDGKILFMPRKINVPAQKYVFDVELTSPAGDVKTIYEEGKPFTWEILQDIS